jgi:predicted nucleic acid-binding Zn ribbon protein
MQVPIYVYKNLKTSEIFELKQSINESALSTHPETGDPVKRLIQPVGIAFKGSGFYVNDSRNTTSTKIKAEPKSESSEAKSESPADAKGEAKSESKAEAKSETKSESKSEAKSESKSETKSETKKESKKSESKPASTPS